ncbi:MAG: YebC/PmpR family DNA-binding transcriptional regulator [Candidatus Nealsonbacteria bacterium CG_4_10_14_0_2_um_filter_40_15]|uniref:Probable transcriptional regulatory protein COX92_00100 n=1 Tax=Candidatus Nealsonbacteria bacterium CG_4_10_14_0_2_um_filter_40_15 TaxID=1974682 RepID=A0A2M7UV53_9BACT|nr:MAG: YebC/PmpR family DNA-binding transcriptional regulator [Candidatus Nealsonbacteria bacterium CG_4_10_14_0_2_um_filter_40_15]
MSGHSHAKTIKHLKEQTDKKRSQMFSKVTRLISVAVKAGGSNTETNSKLRMAIEQAKYFNMPKENVERAIKRAAGEGGEEQLEEVLFETFGPGGVAVLVEGITDNKNRTLGEIKQILNQNGGKLAGEGSVKWLFERKGTIMVDWKMQNADLQNKEKIELIAIEAGADDIYRHDEVLDVYTKPDELEKVKKILEEKGIKIDSASLDWVAKEEIELNQEDKDACQKLFDSLDENDSVQEVYSNLKL